MDFRKTIKGVDFDFEENFAALEVNYIVSCENMTPYEDRFKIMGNVPTWLKVLEEELSEAIYQATD